MNNFSTSEILDNVRTIAFETDQFLTGEHLLKNQNFLMDPTTSARDRRAAFKAVIRLTKNVWKAIYGTDVSKENEIEQAYYLLQAAAVADRMAK